jgi:hypothetical protein
MSDLGLEKRQYYGLQFFNLTHDVPAVADVTFSVDSKQKYVLKNARLSFDRHENSYRYNDEVVISAWSTFEPYIESRPLNNTKFRCEIPVPLLTFSQMCAVAQSRIWNYRSSCKAEAVELQNLADIL